MVKLEDPTLPYADVIPRRRRERAASDGQAFRLGAPGYDWRTTYSTPGSRVVIAASDCALSPAEVEDTVKVIGTVGGVLADLGFQVFPAKAMTGGDLRPSLLIWVGGSATATDERDQLGLIHAPGLSVAPCPLGMPGWRHVDAGKVDDWRRFVKQFIAAVAALVEVPEASFLSNNLSNEPRRTDPDDAGRTSADKAVDQHQRGRRRTRPDGRHPDSAGS
jgi:hypothetical protein